MSNQTITMRGKSSGVGPYDTRYETRFSQVGRSRTVQWPESRLAAALLTRHH
jgi:hypothetical protein